MLLIVAPGLEGVAAVVGVAHVRQHIVGYRLGEIVFEERQTSSLGRIVEERKLRKALPPPANRPSYPMPCAPLAHVRSDLPKLAQGRPVFAPQRNPKADLETN